MAGCSSSVKLPTLGGPPEQRQEMDCDALNAEKARLLAERDDLNRRSLSSTDAEREADLKQVNATPPTRSPPLGSSSSVVR